MNPEEGNLFNKLFLYTGMFTTVEGPNSRHEYIVGAIADHKHPTCMQTHTNTQSPS